MAGWEKICSNANKNILIGIFVLLWVSLPILLGMMKLEMSDNSDFEFYPRLWGMILVLILFGFWDLRVIKLNLDKSDKRLHTDINYQISKKRTKSEFRLLSRISINVFSLGFGLMIILRLYQSYNPVCSGLFMIPFIGFAISILSLFLFLTINNLLIYLKFAKSARR